MMTFASILVLVLSVVYPLLLILGVIVCWKKSFKEGAIFFILMFLQCTIFYFHDKSSLVYFPTYTNSLMLLLITIAVSTLLYGIHRLLKTDGFKLNV